MKDEDLIRIQDKYILIDKIISEGGYGFIYNAFEIQEKDFIRLKSQSDSNQVNNESSKKKGFVSKIVQGLKKKKEIAQKTYEKKFTGHKIKKGKEYALKKMITQDKER